MIRRITPADREAYLSMAHDFYHSEAVLHPVPDEHFVRAFNEMMASDAYLLGLIFESGGQTAGYALLCKTWSQEGGGPCVWIDELFVLPPVRARGLGKAFDEERGRLYTAGCSADLGDARCGAALSSSSASVS